MDSTTHDKYDIGPQTAEDTNKVPQTHDDTAMGSATHDTHDVGPQACEDTDMI